MGILRCTAKYRRLRGLPQNLKDPEPASGALGDWYANTLNVGHARYLHFMSEASRLSVLISRRESSTAEERFMRTLGELLEELGVSKAHAQREVASMEPLIFGKTQSRSVLGSMRDQADMARVHLEFESLWDINLRLSETPCSPLGYDSPREVSLRLIESHWMGPRPVN